MIGHRSGLQKRGKSNDRSIAYQQKLQNPEKTEWAGGFVKDIFSREYMTKEAVKDVSFSIEDGECIGYIGPNGAGKSTTIKMLSGILIPSAGKVVVNGIEPYKTRKANALQVGLVFGQRTQLWWDIPVRDTLELYRKLYNIPEQTYKRNLEIFNDILELDKFDNVAVRQLSLGQRMRADLACAAGLSE